MCSFSEWKSYPGKGIRYVAKDGRTFFYSTRKALKLGLRKVKAQRITWTTAWRRLNHKLKASELKNKRKVRAERRERPIEGISLEEIKRTKNLKDTEKKAIAEQAIRELQERRKKEAEKKKAERKAEAGKNKATKKDEDKKKKVDDKGKAAAKGAAPKGKRR